MVPLAINGIFGYSDIYIPFRNYSVSHTVITVYAAFRKFSTKGSDKLLYDKIKDICKEKGISIAFVEREAGLGNGVISKWNKSSPTIDNLKSVAKVLKVKVGKLID